MNKLPSYSPDRLYLLSELQVHANSIQFLCDLNNNNNISSSGAEVSGDGGEEVGDGLVGASNLQVDEEGASNNNDNLHADKKPAPTPIRILPPSIILYLLWKPNTYPTPKSFVDGLISECVQQILEINGDDNDINNEADYTQKSEVVGERSPPRSTPQSSPYSSPRRQQQQQQQDGVLSGVAFDKLQRKNNNNGSSSFSSGNKNNIVDTAEGGGESGSRESIASFSSITSQSKKQSEEEMKEQQTSRIYVVVDRISSTFTTSAINENEGVGEMTMLPSMIGSNPSSSFDQADYFDDDGSSSPSPAQQQPQNQQQQTQTIEEQEQHHHKIEIQTAEKLARAVASSTFLRNRIDGISIGITSDTRRAAPGLEACMDAVTRGAKERRCAVRDRLVRKQKTKKTNKNTSSNKRSSKDDDDDTTKKKSSDDRRTQSLERLREKSPERSPVAIVAMHPDDLESIDHHHHHHHDHSHHSSSEPNDILQCRVSTEWNGMGQYNSFTDRAMISWRRAWCLHGGQFGDDINGIISGSSNRSTSKNNGGRAVRPKVPRISHNSNGRDGLISEVRKQSIDVDEPISTVMVIVFLVVLVAYLWKEYGDFILDVVGF